MIAPFKTPILQNIKKNGTFREYSVLLLGSATVAAGYVFFITPYKIIPGGVYGISIIIHYLSQGVFSWLPNGLPVGATALIFNVPLWFAAYRLLGKTYGPKTIVTFISTAVFTDFFTFLYGSTEKQIVPNDLLLASIYGGVLIGAGVAFIFKASATSAGTDVIARIISKYHNSQIGTPIIIIDSIVVLIGLIAFRSWEVPLYSWITIFVYGRVVNYMMSHKLIK
jgi:uncharacterized membrane-anchored protein YitT (DUF2179 family)